MGWGRDRGLKDQLLARSHSYDEKLIVWSEQRNIKTPRGTRVSFLPELSRRELRILSGEVQETLNTQKMSKIP